VIDDETLDPLCNSVFSPRVVGAQGWDVHDVNAIRNSPGFAGKSGEDFALAVYDALTSPDDGLWHFWPMNEAVAQPWSNGDVCDPIALLNAYGWAICAQNAEILQALYQSADMPSRIRNLPGHVVCEVWYDGGWHVLDADMRTWFRLPSGAIAGVDDLAADPQGLILDNPNRSQPCNLPDRSLADYAAMYERGRQQGIPIFPFWSTRGVDLDFLLRPGESLTRSRAHSGRFLFPMSWRQRLSGPEGQEWHGLPRERFAPFKTIGNGRWTYAPDLSQRSADVDVGAWARHGLVQDANGIVGPGSLTFRMYSPFPCCGLVDPHDPAWRSHDGVGITLTGEGPVQVDLSDAEGHFVPFESFMGGSFAVELDATMPCLGRREIFIRFTLGPGARLDHFAFAAWIMTAPMAIPRLVAGSNPMEKRVGDGLGQRTTPWLIEANFRSEQDLRQTLSECSRGRIVQGKSGYLRLLPVGSEGVRAHFCLQAPLGREAAWATILVTVPEAGPGDPPVRVTLSWSRDGDQWNRLSDQSIPGTGLGWSSSVEVIIRPYEPCARIWIAIDSDSGVAALSGLLHLVEKARPDVCSIIHHWVERAGTCSYAVPAAARTYTITCGPDPRDHQIEMRVASRLRAASEL